MRMNMRKLSVRGITMGAAVLLGVGMVAGCSSSSDDASDETSGEDTSQVLPPVIVEPGQTEATAKVGDFIDIVVDEVIGTTISTDNSDVL